MKSALLVVLGIVRVAVVFAVIGAGVTLVGHLL